MWLTRSTMVRGRPYIEVGGCQEKNSFPLFHEVSKGACQYYIKKIYIKYTLLSIIKNVVKKSNKII